MSDKITVVPFKEGKKLDKKIAVLTLDQEILVVQRLLETRDINIASQQLSMAYEIVLQVAVKYSDVIGLLVQNTLMNNVIQKSYEETLKKALKTNATVVDLLARQVQILWNEYNKPENKDVLMKDFLIEQVLQIQDRLQKIIDKNDIQYKMNKDFLLRQMGMRKVDESEEDGEYVSNVEAVFTKLKAKSDAMLGVKRTKSLLVNSAPINRYIFYAAERLEDGTYTEPVYYDSCEAFAREKGIKNQAVQKGMRIRFMRNERQFIYRYKYLISNLKRGDELENGK